MTGSDAQTRRGFVGWLAAGLAAVPFLGGLAATVRSAATPEKTERPQRIPLCKKADVPATGLVARPVTYQMRRGPRVETVATTVFVTREPQSGEIIALSSRCTHLGCPVVHRPDQEAAPPGGPPRGPLHCPCHDATFSATGDVLDGPPKRPLDRLTIEVPALDDGMILLVL